MTKYLALALAAAMAFPVSAQKAQPVAIQQAVPGAVKVSTGGKFVKVTPAQWGDHTREMLVSNTSATSNGDATQTDEEGDAAGETGDVVEETGSDSAGNEIASSGIVSTTIATTTVLASLSNAAPAPPPQPVSR